jgi:hypothetical protein
MNFRHLCISLTIFISFIVTAQNTPHADSFDLNNIDTSTAGVFEKVGIEASFQGGDPGWRKFLEKNLRADVASKNGAPVGKYTVWIQFIVDKNGVI